MQLIASVPTVVISLRGAAVDSALREWRFSRATVRTGLGFILITVSQ